MDPVYDSRICTEGIYTMKTMNFYLYLVSGIFTEAVHNIWTGTEVVVECERVGGGL